MNAIEVVNRAQWLAIRQEGIGASEAAAVFGHSKYLSPLGLYLLKTNAVEPQPETFPMKLGTMLEPIIARLYEEETGRRIVNQQMFGRMEGKPHIMATPDALDSEGDLCEWKSIGSLGPDDELGDDGTDELPTPWLFQAQQQMAIFDRPRVRFGVLIGARRFRQFTVDRNDDFIATLLRGIDEFWFRHVKGGIPPEATHTDLNILKRLRPYEGETRQLFDDIRPDVEQFIELGESIKQLQQDRDAAQARLIAALGQAETGILADGTEIHRKEVRRKSYTVAETSYMSFRIKTPKGGRD